MFKNIEYKVMIFKHLSTVIKWNCWKQMKTEANDWQVNNLIYLHDVIID